MSEENNTPPATEAAPKVVERRVVEKRGAGLFRQFLLFLAGLLVGANGVYYWMQRDAARAATAAAPTSSLPAPNATPSRAPASTEPPARIIVDPHGSEPAMDMPAAPAALATTTQPSALLIPVQGVAAAGLIDTFTQARGASRVHDAIDIMAPQGTPVLAVTDGTVAKLFDSKAGGITLYQFDPSGRFVYYYAHLKGYAPGMAEGKALKQGEVIGYVGSTGNANPEAPHLHFAVGTLTADKQWWDYTAINPYPLLSGG